MATCSFCGKNVNENEGLIYVLTDGKTKRFCGSKCTKNALKLKRQPRKVKWVKQ